TRAGGELGRLAADAQRALARSQLALVNPGSLRADVDAGPIAYGELFEAQAYDHRVLRMELTGREVRALLERSALYRSGVPGGGSLDPGATYTVAVNELLATRPGFPAGRGATPVGTEVEALAAQVARFTAAQRARHKRVTGADRRSPKLEAR
ncbi:MAG: 5'-nucleotidase C-terminal domain-containing protein, partial [Thermoleophilaceae bacterium]